MELYHEGKPRRSGRYPYGSGERPFQRLKTATRNRLIAAGTKKVVKEKVKDVVSEGPIGSQTVTDAQKNVKEISRRRITKKNIRTLSDDEIVRNISRLRNEKILKDLIDDDISPIEKAVKNILNDSGKKIGSEVATGGIRYVLKQSMVGGEMTLPGLAEAIWPKKDKKKKEKDNDD